MKQKEVALIALAGSLISFSAGAGQTGQFTSSDTRNSHSQDGSWQNTLIHASSPADISSAVKKRIKYQRDMYNEDEWRSAEETWNRRRGDCEDIAETVRKLCCQKGLQAQILVFYSKTDREAHAVAAGETNGRIWISSNGNYRDFNSFYDAKQELARDLGWYAPNVKVLRAVSKDNRSGSCTFFNSVPKSDSRHPELMPYDGSTKNAHQLPYFPASN